MKEDFEFCTKYFLKLGNSDLVEPRGYIFTKISIIKIKQNLIFKYLWVTYTVSILVYWVSVFVIATSKAIPRGFPACVQES